MRFKLTGLIKWKRLSVGGNYLTFETRKEATDAQLELAAKEILANHPYKEDFLNDQKQKALDTPGFSYENEESFSSAWTMVIMIR